MENALESATQINFFWLKSYSLVTCALKDFQCKDMQAYALNSFNGINDQKTYFHKHENTQTYFHKHENTPFLKLLIVLNIKTLR